MGKFLIGIILILFGGTITTESFIIELTPNFIGSLLLLFSMKDFQVKHNKIQKSLYILTGLFLINYILQILMPDGIINILSSILAGVTLLWGLYLAIKLIEQIKKKQEIASDNIPLLRWFWVLFAVTMVLQVALILFNFMPKTTFISIIAFPWMLILCALIVLIGSCRLTYLFYKELKFLSSNK